MRIDLTRIGRLHVALVALAVATALATRWLDAGSVLLGGAVMGVNFWLLQLIVRALLPSGQAAGGTRRAAMGVAAMTVKFGLFMALLAALFWRLPISGMSFAFGVSLLLVACVVEAVRAEFLMSKGVG